MNEPLTANPIATVVVDLGERSYPIVIEADAMLRADLWQAHLASEQVVVVSNTTVAPLYAAALIDVLRGLGKKVSLHELPDGEAYKTIEHWHGIMDTLLSQQCDRKTTLIALGGGVVGDMTGFAAAAYMRGVAFIQVPTTLLAQVDSSVGGKTGINHPMGKNMIGAFYQPHLVIADLTSLGTLPDREFSAGMAEIIKHAAIIDTDYLAWLEANITPIMARDQDALQYAIARSCQIKAAIVAADEREGGQRAWLNFGHTFGHAIEAGMGYGNWLHGEAVAVGMLYAAHLSLRLGQLRADEVARLQALIAAAGLPTEAPDLASADMPAWMQVDKKNQAGQIRFVLLDGLGRAQIQSVDDKTLQMTLECNSLWAKL